MTKSKLVNSLKSVLVDIRKFFTAVMVGLSMGMGMRHDPNTEVKRSGKSTSQDK